MYHPFWVDTADGTLLEVTRNIHARYRLPAGCTFTRVPVDAEVDFLDLHARPDLQGHGPDVEAAISRIQDLVYSWSFVTDLVSVLQLLYAMSPLYHSKGDQIEQYGYAAFGLTVAPYAVMSFVNIFSTVVAVEFPKLCIVNSPIMREALERGGSFAGVVGKLRDAEEIHSFAFVEGHLERHDRAVLWKPRVTEAAADAGRLNQNHTVALDGNLVEAPDQQGTQSGDWYRPLPGVIALPNCPSSVRASLHDQDSVRRKHHVSQILNTLGWVTSARRRPRHTNIVPIWGLRDSLKEFVWIYIILYGPGTASVSLVSGLSRWHKGRSTKAERIWTMMWLGFGAMMNGP